MVSCERLAGIVRRLVTVEQDIVEQDIEPTPDISAIPDQLLPGFDGSEVIPIMANDAKAMTNDNHANEADEFVDRHEESEQFRARPRRDPALRRKLGTSR